jgi:hypothetical protein
MDKAKKIMAAMIALSVLSVAAPASADAPGAGSKQCKPGQTQNPNDPPKRPGSCPGS